MTDDLTSLPMWADLDDIDDIETDPGNATSADNDRTAQTGASRVSPRAALAGAGRRVSTGTAPTDPTALPGVFGEGKPLAAGLTPPPKAAQDQGGTIDWVMVKELRQAARDRVLTEAGTHVGLDAQGEQELARTVILELIREYDQRAVTAGEPGWSFREKDELATAVFDAVYGLGRLQPLVDADEVENVEIYGADRVLVELNDGTLQWREPVADSDEELTDYLTFLASNNPEGNARPFSPSNPILDMRLPGGARLAAVAWVVPRPVITIRRHRLRQVTLDDLVTRNTLTTLQASFLKAAIRAREYSVVVSGPMSGGKTTLTRALCAEIDPWEKIGTFETEHELHLYEMVDQHQRVVAFEARPGSGEIGADGRSAGEFTIDEALYASFRHNLDRQIVGEVRGTEARAMIKAMASGAGSISTTHAKNAIGAVDKLITCILETGAREDYATRVVLGHIDLIVQLRKQRIPGRDGAPGRIARWVSEIIQVSNNFGGLNPVGRTQIFGSVPGLEHSVACELPDAETTADLVRYGFDLEAFNAEKEHYHPQGRG